jgi:hypothetical protein
MPALLGGAGASTFVGPPSSVPLTLGAVTFLAGECPDTLPIGGIEQEIATTRLAGGGEVNQPMGGFAKDVTWQGKFWAGNVAPRVRTLQGYTADGVARLISWGPERYYCVVKDFVPPYHHQFFAEYQITVKITGDANGVLTNRSAASVEQQLGGLSDSANVSASAIAAADASAQTLQVDVSNIKLQIESVGQIAQAPQSSIAQLLATVSTALAKAGAYADALPVGSAMVVAAQRYIAALSLIQTAVTNGQAQRTIQVQGGSIYDVAAQIGDVTRAFEIMRLNGLPSPQLPESVATLLRVPPGLRKP